MKKHKKKLRTILLIFLCIALVSSLLCIHAFCAPYGRHEVSNKEPFMTEEFLPKPDSIAVIRGGIAIEVSEEKRDQLYDVFLQMMESVLVLDGKYCDNPFKQIHASIYTTVGTGIEFRYEQRVSFAGKICYEEYEVDYADDPREFDAFLFVIGASNAIAISKYIDNDYTGFYGQKQWAVFNREEMKNFKKAIKDII